MGSNKIRRRWCGERNGLIIIIGILLGSHLSFHDVGRHHFRDYRRKILRIRRTTTGGSLG